MWPTLFQIICITLEWDREKRSFKKSSDWADGCVYIDSSGTWSMKGADWDESTAGGSKAALMPLGGAVWGTGWALRKDILGNMDGWVVCACVGHMYLIVWDRLGVTDSGCPLRLNPFKSSWCSDGHLFSPHMTACESPISNVFTAEITTVSHPCKNKFEITYQEYVRVIFQRYVFNEEN